MKITNDDLGKRVGLGYEFWFFVRKSELLPHEPVRQNLCGAPQ